MLFRSHNPDYADGGQMRDFVWVGDCADVVLGFSTIRRRAGCSMSAPARRAASPILRRAVFRAMGRAPDIEFVDTPAAIRDKYQYFTEARMDRLRAAGYAKPATSLEDGVTRYVRDFLAAPDPYL